MTNKRLHNYGLFMMCIGALAMLTSLVLLPYELIKVEVSAVTFILGLMNLIGGSLLHD